MAVSDFYATMTPISGISAIEPGVHHVFGEMLGLNATRMFSPITMNSSWSTLGRLTVILFLTTTGTITNGFFIASFFIERPLEQLGNVYLASAGLADMLITTIVMPTSAVVLISRQWDIPPVCYTLQFLSQASVYIYSLLYLCVGLENHFRLCRSYRSYKAFMSFPVALVTIMTYIIGFVVSGIGVFMEKDYDYCYRHHEGDFVFRIVTLVMFHIIPFVVTTTLLISTSLSLKMRARKLAQYRRSLQFDQDYSFINVNIICFIVFVLAWLPYVVVVNVFPNASDTVYYNCVCLGLSRSIITSLIYSGLNKNFRQGFAHLFYYCCCKSSLSVPYNHRHRRAMELRGTGPFEVSVHILHNASLNNTQRSQRQNRELELL